MQIDLMEYRLQLKHTFRISRDCGRDFVDVAIVRIHHLGFTGYGEASPSKYWGEDIESVKAAFSELNFYKYPELSDYEGIIKNINSTDNPPRSLLAAIEMAILDCVSKSRGQSVRQLLGIPSDRNVRSSFTIGIADLNTIELKVQEAAKFPILKVKLGADNDIQIIEKIRSQTNKTIRVDANEGWTKEEAVKKINWLENQNVEFVEQPLLASQNENMAWVKARVNLPLFADESVKNSSDIPALVNFFDGINIKLMKCGGILEALSMIQSAKQSGMKVMAGCMTESSLAISAGAQFLPLLDFADLDGFELISNDPFTGLTMTDGYISINNNLGLGVSPKNELYSD